MEQKVENYTDGKCQPDDAFTALVEHAKNDLGWKHFIIHRLRQDGACESQIHIDGKIRGHSVCIHTMAASIIESVILQASHGEDRPKPGDKGYDDWLKKNIIALLMTILQHR